MRLGTDLTRVWCCYEFAWWLKHKGEGSIAFVPLVMYSAILRLVLKGVPLFAAVLTALLYPLAGPQQGNKKPQGNKRKIIP